jgi:hypothetical protein
MFPLRLMVVDDASAFLDALVRTLQSDFVVVAACDQSANSSGLPLGLAWACGGPGPENRE